MNGTRLCNQLHSEERAYGTLIVSTSPHWVSMTRKLGLDFVFIDTEHIAIDRQTLSWMCQAYNGHGLASVVRIPSPDPYEASTVIDGGAQGVIAPYIESPEQIRDLVGAVKFKPLKGERLQAAVAAPEGLETDLRRYLDAAGRERVMIINIESVPALNRLDELLDVPGLDGVLIGPHDLSCSLGIPEQYEDDRFIDAVETIIRKARAKGLGAGIHTITPSLARNTPRWVEAGANVIVHSADIIAASEKLGADVAEMRSQFGDERENSTQGGINI